MTRYLQGAGFVVQVMQPLQVKAFAKLHLPRAKNDRIDAGLIAACSQMLGCIDKLPPDARFDVLGDHLTAIEQWEEDIVRYKVRREHEHDARRRRILEQDIERLTKRRAAEPLRLQAELCYYADLSTRFYLRLGPITRIHIGLVA